MIIRPNHFEYLYIQRGEVAAAYQAGFAAWRAAYEASLAAIMDSMSTVLPASVNEILDIGGGMGGIGILLRQWYPAAGYRILDGVSDEPKVRSSRKTFNDVVVASSFLTANGVENFGFYEPGEGFDRKFDLVVSFAAWGFHIPPDEYLEQVRAALAPKAVVVLDSRKNRPDWLKSLVLTFGSPRILDRGKKHVRLAWQT